MYADINEYLKQSKLALASLLFVSIFWFLSQTFLSINSILVIFQVADAKEKRKKGIFGKPGGDKEVSVFA